MASKSGRARKNLNHKDKFVRLDHEFLKRPAWRALPADAKVLYIEGFELRYNGVNNGDIRMSEREASEIIGRTSRGQCTQKHAANMIKALEELGYIRMRRDSSFHMKCRLARLWELTRHSLNGAKPGMDFCRCEPPLENKQQRSSEPQAEVLRASHAHAYDVPRTAVKGVPSVADKRPQDIIFRSTMGGLSSLQLASDPERTHAVNPKGAEMGQPTKPPFGHPGDELSNDTRATEEFEQRVEDFGNSGDRENAETAKPNDLINSEKFEKLWRLQKLLGQQRARGKAEEEWTAALNRGTDPDVIVERFMQHQAHWIEHQYPIDKIPDMATWLHQRRWLDNSLPPRSNGKCTSSRRN